MAVDTALVVAPPKSPPRLRPFARGGLFLFLIRDIFAGGLLFVRQAVDPPIGGLIPDTATRRADITLLAAICNGHTSWSGHGWGHAVRALTSARVPRTRVLADGRPVR